MALKRQALAFLITIEIRGGGREGHWDALDKRENLFIFLDFRERELIYFSRFSDLEGYHLQNQQSVYKFSLYV